MASLNVSAGTDGGLTAQATDVSVESALAGVSVQPLPMSSGTNGPNMTPELTLPVEVRADGAASPGIDTSGAGRRGTGQENIWLNVRQDAQSLRVRLPVLWVSRAALPTSPGLGAPAPGSSFYAATVPCGLDIYVFAPLNAPLERRARLLRKTRTELGVKTAMQSCDLGLAWA